MDTHDNPHARPARVALRDGRRLLEDLARIDTFGWSHPVATALLVFVRDDLVRPLVQSEGLRGLAAEQAEATGWEAAWETLNSPGLRAAPSPWGVVWTVVRRAVRQEAVAAKYCTGLDRAWRVRAHCRSGPALTPVSWDRLAEVGIEPDLACDSRDPEQFGTSLTAIVEAMTGVGWDRDCATTLVRLLADTSQPGVDRARVKVGWRPIAAELGLPPWQVRRTMVLLLGEPGWEGLLPRVRRGGVGVLTGVAVVAAVRSTTTQWMRPPGRAASRAGGLARDVAS